MSIIQLVSWRRHCRRPWVYSLTKSKGLILLPKSFVPEWCFVLRKDEVNIGRSKVEESICRQAITVTYGLDDDACVY